MPVFVEISERFVSLKSAPKSGKQIKVLERTSKLAKSHKVDPVSASNACCYRVNVFET